MTAAVPAGVAVVGGANLDVVLHVAALPRPGETVLATVRTTGPGGKGANQALAAARSGAPTALVAALGDDDAGRELRAALVGVDLSAVRTTGTRSGTAYVLVDRDGENSIVVDAGANGELLDLRPDELRAVTSATVLLCSLEVPVVTVTAAVRAARAAGVLTVVNAAPATALPEALTEALDVLVVNEHEALVVSGAGSLDEAVEGLLARVPEVVVTLGAAGALLGVRGAATRLVAGWPARAVVDTTGAGDVFCGAYAAARARGAAGPDAADVA